MNWVNTLEQWKKQVDDNPPPELRNDYHARIEGKDTLVVALGDSWTWGERLDDSQRLNQVYGKLVADDLEADWINIGCRGMSSSWVLLHGPFIVEQIKQHTNYKKIYIIIVLTESGRDVATYHSFKYDYIKCFEKYGVTTKFYDQIMKDIEEHYVQQVQDILDCIDERFTVFLSENIVWHEKLHQSLIDSNVILSNLNWVEVLADVQGLDRPIRTNVLHYYTFDKIEQANQIVGITDNSVFKKWVLPLLEKAIKINNWVDTSQLNYDSSSSHPTAEGHRVWADYVVNQLKVS
jgi:lysophospholipase L1-like esterase